MTIPLFLQPLVSKHTRLYAMKKAKDMCYSKMRYSATLLKR